MKQLTYNITIHSTPEIVWNCLWEVENYKIWTRPFHEGSYYKANKLAAGELIYFLTPEGHGMTCIIEKCIVDQQMDIRHLGEMGKISEQDLQEKINSGEGVMETYSLEKSGEITRLRISIDAPDEYSDFMDKAFQESLNILKEMSEKNSTQ